MPSGENPNKSSRTLTEEERVLWRKVTHTVVPWKERWDRDDTRAAIEQAPPAKPEFTGIGRVPPAGVNRGSKDRAPALDRKTREKISRSRAAIDATLDLHGMRQAEAHIALRRFLANAQQRGAKFVIVITGKGDRNRNTTSSEHGSGVLRNAVPHWLGTAELRPFVVGYDEAAPHHGGGGAIYIHIRRPRRIARSDAAGGLVR